MSSKSVTLIGKPGCHLCDQTREVIERVCKELNASWNELSILEDENLARQYAEFIPVVLLDGKPFDQFGVSEQRLRTALLQ